MPGPVPLRRFLAVSFALGLILGLTGGALLLLESHCRRFERVAYQDFRVAVFLKKGLPERAVKVAQDKLGAVPDVDGTTFVSPDESLADLRQEDAELFESVAILGENPLPAALDVRMSPDGIARVHQLVAQAFAMEEVADVRYKSAQVAAILQARFYGSVIGLAVNAAMTLSAACMLAGIWLRKGRSDWGQTLAVGAGALAGQGAVFLLAFPMRRHLLHWDAPRSWRVLLWVLCAAGLAWSLDVVRAAAQPKAKEGRPEDALSA
ncbi:MAG: hypothetical protein HY927_10350 [Elusimicrobia bacterium]|nr:hypothetical protein [Elusimicrobiota bacterium]